MPRSRRRTLAGLVVTATVADGIAFSGAPAAHAAEPDPILIAGNFIDDGLNRDEVVYYQPGTGTDYMFWDWQRVGTSASFLPDPLTSINATYTPIVGDFDGDGFDEILWYRRGTAQDKLWDFPDGNLSQGPVVHLLTVNGPDYRPIAGDFTNDGADDVIWYAPGAAGDTLWDFASGTTFEHTSTVLDPGITGDHIPLAGRFAGTNPSTADNLWVRTDGAGVVLWDNEAEEFTPTPSVLTAPGGTGYSPIVLDTRNDGYDDVMWYRPGTGSETYWDFTNAGLHTISSASLNVPGTYKAAAGDVFGDGHDDILWIGGTASSLWDWHLNSNGELVRDGFSLPSASAAAAVETALAVRNSSSTSSRNASGDHDRVVIQFTEREAGIDADMILPSTSQPDYR